MPEPTELRVVVGEHLDRLFDLFHNLSAVAPDPDGDAIWLLLDRDLPREPDHV